MVMMMIIVVMIVIIRAIIVCTAKTKQPCFVTSCKQVPTIMSTSLYTACNRLFINKLTHPDSGC